MSLSLRSGPVEFGPAIALNGRKPFGIGDYTFVRIRKFSSTEWAPEAGMVFKDNKVWGNVAEIQLQAGSPDYANFPGGKLPSEVAANQPTVTPQADPIVRIHITVEYKSGRKDILGSMPV